MASAMVNNAGPVAPEGFLDPSPSAAAFSSYGWLSPRISFSHEFSDDDEPQAPAAAIVGSPRKSPASRPLTGRAAEDADLDFEFSQVDDPVAMLPADELFSDGKLVPRQLAPIRRQPEAAATSSLVPPPSEAEIRSPVPEKPTLQRAEEGSPSDPYSAFSPKAPSCTSRWRELLRLRKAAQPRVRKSSSKSSSSSTAAAAMAVSSNGSAAWSLKHLHRNPRSSPSSVDSSLSRPLLGDSDSYSPPIPSRRSVSSSPSSRPDHVDHPRLSLDTEKPGEVSIPLGRNPTRLRLVPRPYQVPANGRVGRQPSRRAPGDARAIPARSASVDSPRVSSSGKVVFQGLGRSSSSPSALHGGPRGKHRGAERSHPGNVVRVAPVLNVPVCSLRGSARSSGSVFGLAQLFSAPQKKDSAAGSSSSGAARSGGGGRGGGRIERA